MAAEGTMAGRRVAVARHRHDCGEGSCEGTAVWAEVRRPVSDGVVVVQQRVFERRPWRAPVTGYPVFDRRCKVWPRRAAPDLPRSFLTAVLRSGRSPWLVLAPGAVQLDRDHWLAPPGLEELLAEALALAAATDPDHLTGGAGS